MTDINLYIHNSPMIGWHAHIPDIRILVLGADRAEVEAKLKIALESHIAHQPIPHTPLEAAYIVLVENEAVRSRKCEDWLLYHQQNHHVYDEFVRTAKEAMGKGYKKWGVTGVLEIIRWFGSLVITGDHEFKIANDHATYYSRWIMMHEPDLYKFFDTKPADADHEIGWTAFKAAKKKLVTP